MARGEDTTRRHVKENHAQQQQVQGNFKLMVMASLVVMMLGLGGVDALSVMSGGMGRSHHIKRQSSSKTPMLTLDIEPTHGIDPTHTDPEVPLYRFPVDSGRYNFTCTIKHPQHRYKLTISREQTLSDGTVKTVDFIDPGDYKLNPVHSNGRTRVEFSEPEFIDSSATFIRLSLIIENLKVEDSGIYVCKYSSIIKKINAVIYRTPHEDDVVIATNPEPVRIGHPATITCAVSNVYPKPSITLMHSVRESVQNSVSVQDVSSSAEATADPNNPYHLYNLTATYTFTPTHADFMQKITCLVLAHGISNKSIDNSKEIDVQGSQIIDKSCEKAVAPKPGEAEIKLSCAFFSNPRYETSFWEFEEDAPASSTAPTGGAENLESGGGGVSAAGDDLHVAPPTSAENAVNELVTTAAATEKRRVQLRENEDNPNYIYRIEESENAGSSAIYTAVLTIKSIQPQFLKEYTFHVGDVQKTIKVYADETQKDLSLKAEIASSGALVKSHSTVCILSLAAALLFVVGLLF